MWEQSRQQLKILLVHNFYKHAGGEDKVFACEQKMLEDAGHRVTKYTRANVELEEMWMPAAAMSTIWNSRTYQEVQAVLSRERPDIIHCHNTFPLVSPSIFWAASKARVPIVQTLHNYRLLCAAATHLRDGVVCEDCTGWRLPVPAILHKCYRGDFPATVVLGCMSGVHKAIGTYSRKVDRFIALTGFMRGKLIAAGIPAAKVSVKGNTVPEDPGIGGGHGGYILYAGRLSEEKGVGVLCQAWCDEPELPRLVLAGDGPLSNVVRETANRCPNVLWEGPVNSLRVSELMKNARYLIVPSICYEGFPAVVAEAFATGLPVLTSKIGALEEIVEEGRTGMFFDAANVAALLDTVKQALEANRLYDEMRRNARKKFESCYSTEVNCRQLTAIYSEVLKQAETDWR